MTKKFAVIEHGKVTNVVLSDAKLDDSWVDITSMDPQPGIGWPYDGTFHEPAQPTLPEPVNDPCEWLIDIGPFFDRFGANKMAVLMCTDPAVKAILSDIQVRKWIDLQRTDVASSLAYVGSVIPAITPTIQNTILTTPVAYEENRALRKLFF